MSELRLALMQLYPAESKKETCRLGLEACRRAKEAGADIALFPEMWSCGYRMEGEPAHWAARAIPVESPFIEAYRAVAQELSMAVAVTFLECCETGPKNSLVLFDRHGKEVLRYAKVHTCDFDVERYLTPGDGFHVAALDTAAGEVQVGAMICYDREFPESARILMLQGAELILVPNACPMEQNRLAQLRARAFENMLCVATCNYPEGYPDCNGHSSVFDGIAFGVGDEPYDMCRLEAPGDAGIYLAHVDLDALRRYREAEAFGNAYRHPRKYHALIEEEIRAPFRRPDYRPS